ncbi:MAG: ABC transporter permease [Acidobacteriaceae bacterium]
MTTTRWLNNLRYSWRQLRKSPGFTLTAVLTLAFGIGANVAVFSVMNAVLLNPSGIPNPERVVALRARYSVGDLKNIPISAPDFQDAASAKGLISAAAVMLTGNLNYSAAGMAPQRLVDAQVSSQFFDVFLARPLIGRAFRAEEDMPDANREVVLSYPTWRRRFGGDPAIVGKKLELNQVPYEVIGVMGPEFGWPNEAEAWTPLGWPPARFLDQQQRHNESLFGLARLRPGVSVAQMNAYLEMKARQQIASEGSASDAAVSGWGMFSMPLVDFVAGSLTKPLSVLMYAVMLVLLIACANIAGLQLARASDRQREVSVRIALGAPRRRLLEQAFTESMILAVLGVGLGLVLAKTAIPLLLLLAPQNLVRNIGVHLSGPVLLYVAAAGVLCALFCGIAPAWRMTRLRWFQALQEGGRSGSSSRGSQRLRSSLVVGEIALAMLLLVGAGLLVRSLTQLEKVNTGFDPQGQMSATVSLPKVTYPKDEQQAAFANALEEQLKNQTGVMDAALADSLPFTDNGGAASFTILGRTLAPTDPGPHGNIREVSPDYFSTMRIPLLRGRAFASTDRLKTEHVAIVDEVLAKQYWPGQDPIGQHISFARTLPPITITIVGVVEHARKSSLESDNNEGFYYLPIAQSPRDTLQIVARTKGNPENLKAAIQNAVHAVDPNQAVYDFKSMEQRVDESLVGRRFLVVLLSIFAGLALLLAALGLYGVISYGVRLRVRELGLRMALGAQRGDVLRLVIKGGMQLAVIGIGIGLAATFLAGQAIASMLYKTSVYNPLTLIETAVLLTLVVLLASYLPARRASRLDPMRTLREE